MLTVGRGGGGGVFALVPAAGGDDAGPSPAAQVSADPTALEAISLAAGVARSAVTELSSLDACIDPVLPSLRALYLTDDQKVVEGRSLGLSVALWAAARALGLDLSCDAALGEIDSAGRVLAVHGAQAKLKALAAVGLGLSRIWAPAAMRDELGPLVAALWPEADVELILVGHLDEAFAQLTVEARHTRSAPTEAERRAQLGAHLRAVARGVHTTAPRAALVMLREWQVAATHPWDRWAADWARAIAERHAGEPARCPPVAQPAGPPGGYPLGLRHRAALAAHFAQTHADAPGAEGARADLDRLSAEAEALVAADEGEAAAPLFGAIGRATLMLDPALAAERCALAARLLLVEAPNEAGRSMCAWLIAAGASGEGVNAAREAARAVRAAWARGAGSADDYAFLNLAEARALLSVDPAAAAELAGRAARAALPPSLVYLRLSALRVGWLAGPATAPTPAGLDPAIAAYGAIYAGLHQLDRALRSDDHDGLRAARAALLQPGGAKSPQLLAVLQHLIGGVDLDAPEGAAALAAKLRCFPY